VGKVVAVRSPYIRLGRQLTSARIDSSTSWTPADRQWRAHAGFGSGISQLVELPRLVNRFSAKTGCPGFGLGPLTTSAHLSPRLRM